MGFAVLAGGAASRSVSLTISGSTNNYDVASAIAATGRSVAQGGLFVRLTIANGVIVGSTSTGTAALLTGAGWGAGGQVRILVPSGSARIQGRGGNGGKGDPFDAGGGEFGRRGGGGGGAGTNAGNGASNGGSAGTATTGGSGGTSTNAGDDGTTGTNGFPGGHAIEATSGGPNVFLEPAAGATLEVWGGGGGGGGRQNTGTAGAGGGPGLDGANVVGGYSGGAHGKAYSTPGAATITEVGPGTIDDRGT